MNLSTSDNQIDLSTKDLYVSHSNIWINQKEGNKKICMDLARKKEIKSKFCMRRMTSFREPQRHCRLESQANLVVKKPLDLETALGRNTGKRGCERGMELGKANC